MPLPPFVIPRFDPRRIPGLHSWWDASDSASVTLDAGRVSQLSDKSGNARHLTNTTSGSTQPSYVTGARNGLNVARFAAASVQRLSVASSTATYKYLHDGTPCWWIAVTTYGDTTDPNAIMSLMATCSTASAQVGFYYCFEDRSGFANNAANLGAVRGSSGTYVIAYDGQAALQNIITPQTMTVQEALMDAGNATAASRFALRINGGSSLSANVYTGTPSTANAAGNLTVGALTNNGAPMTGDVCELMLFSSQPTAAARDLIRRYLGAKWGVSVG